MTEGAGGPPVEDAPDQPDELSLRLDWRSAAWISGGVVVGLLAIALTRNVLTSLTRVAIGLLLAFALDPLVVRIRNRFGWSRAEAVLAVGTVATLLVGFLVLVLGPAAVRQAERFGGELPETVEQLYGVPVLGPILEDRNAAEDVREWADDLPASVDTKSVTATARRILDGALAAVVVLLVGLSVLIDGDLLVRRLNAALPESVRPRAQRIGNTFYRTFGAYFSGSLLVASLTATYVLTIGLAFSVPLAPLAAMWVLAVNLIPQIGGFLGGSLFTLLAFTASATTGVICLVLFLIWMNLENHVITPAIVGQAVDLSPPATMLAAIIGGAAAGVPGALVATPLVGATKSLYLELRWGKVPEVRARPSLWSHAKNLAARVRGRPAAT